MQPQRTHTFEVRVSKGKQTRKDEPNKGQKTRHRDLRDELEQRRPKFHVLAADLYSCNGRESFSVHAIRQVYPTLSLRGTKRPAGLGEGGRPQALLPLDHRRTQNTVCERKQERGKKEAQKGTSPLHDTVCGSANGVGHTFGDPNEMKQQKEKLFFRALHVGD